MNKDEIVSEANKLVRNGLHKAAIDLLLKYLKINPKSSTVLNILGRVYILDHQPEKAVTYLKRSLEVNQSFNNDSKEYRADDFDDDDMAYVDDQAKKISEDIYKICDDDPTQSHEEIARSGPSNRRPLIRINPGKYRKERLCDNSNDIKITYRKKRKVILSDSTNSRVKSAAIEKCQKEVSQLQHSDADKVSIHGGDSDKILSSIQEDQQFQKSKPNSQAKIVGSIPVRETATQPSIEALQDNDQEILVEDEEFLLDELFIDEIDEEDDDELLDDIQIYDSLPLLEEESDEQIWDNFDDLDEFDELAQREAGKEVPDRGEISREYRAQQIAVEVLANTDWETIYLPLLKQIFIENGWSAARVSIENEIIRGLTPEELVFARKLRRFWSENEQYWITFHKIKSNTHFKQADAAYKHMSWPESLRIIKCFPSLPDIEEIYALINEAFEIWYNSNRLRRSFKAFFKFLKYRIGSMYQTLPGDCAFYFLESVDVGIDSDDFSNQIRPESQELLELGLSLNYWPRPPENKMKVIKE